MFVSLNYQNFPETLTSVIMQVNDKKNIVLEVNDIVVVDNGVTTTKKGLKMTMTDITNNPSTQIDFILDKESSGELIQMLQRFIAFTT